MSFYWKYRKSNKLVLQTKDNWQNNFQKGKW